MAKQTVNIGTSANKGNGDPLRTAFTKINNNFDELYSALGSDGDLFDPNSVDQSLVPTTTNTVDLGSASKQWRSLYVSNNTIYIGGTAVGVDANGNLTTGGTVVGSTPDWNSITGKPTFASVATSGAYGDLSGRPTIPTLTSQLTNDSNFITTAVLANGLDADLKGSVFADDSTLMVDAVNNKIYATELTVTVGNFVNVNSNNVDVENINGLASQINFTVGGYNNLVIENNLVTIQNVSLSVAGDITLGGDIKSETGINIDINLSDSTLRRWQFGEDGHLTLPAGGDIKDSTGTSVLGGGSVSSLVNGAYTVSLGSTGTLTLPASGIITTADDEFFKLQAKDTDSALRNEIKLDPNNGTFMSVWSEELSRSFSTSDWATASWQNNNGQGYAIITNAEDLQDFWTTYDGSFVDSVEVSINGGARTPVTYIGDNEEQYDVELSINAVPGSTTAITSLVFYYRTKNSINIDYNEGDILLDAQALNIKLQTTADLNLESGQYLNLKSTGSDTVRIYTDNPSGVHAPHIWEFNTTGSLTLPREGKIYGVGLGAADDRYGYITWDGDSSAGGLGYNTMKLVPDLQGLEDAHTYIILDPAYVDGETGSIHIRAGGTPDNSLANLCFGGANSHVKISAGLNPPVTVKANSNSWTFGTDGRTTFPNGTVPEHSYGAAGDKEGMVVFTDPYIYYCKQDYVNNSTNIWVRVAWTGTSW